MPKIIHELCPAEKLAIQLYTETDNASYAYSQAYPGKYDHDKKGATDRMKKLLLKPLANEYQIQIRQEAEQKINISKEWLFDKIIALQQKSENAMDFSSRVKCLFLIAKMQGYMSKQVIDVRKSISITFGGGYNPEQNPTLFPNETKTLLLDETIGEEARISLDSLSKIEIQDEKGVDTSKLDEF